MWYIIQDGEHIELEFGYVDVLNYVGETIHCECEDGLPDGTHVINDVFLLAYDWFEDTEDWDIVNAYRKCMGCSILEAWEQCMEAYVGQYASEADFSKRMNEEYLSGLPSHIKSHIDWQGVWDSTDRHSYFESDGFYFENL